MIATRFFAAVAVGIAASCAHVPPIEYRSLSENNPATYVFAAPYARVLNAVDTLCSKNRLPEFQTPSSREVSGCHRWSEAVRGGPPRFYYTPNYHPSAQSDEISIFTNGFPSRSYFSEGKPLETSVHFRVDINKVEPHKGGSALTAVTVTAVDLEVFHGTVRAMHGGTARHVAHLKSTSIEEYEILLYLGRLLGEAGMPSLQLPQAQR